MKPLILISVLLVASCSSHSKSASQTQAPLDSQSAKLALVAYIEAHPATFTSPGRTENATDIRKACVDSKKKEGMVNISRFSVDLDKRTYRLVHGYGKPGGGWFENWIWEGQFTQKSNGRWQATEPRFIKAWGK